MLCICYLPRAPTDAGIENHDLKVSNWIIKQILVCIACKINRLIHMGISTQACICTYTYTITYRRYVHPCSRKHHKSSAYIYISSDICIYIHDTIAFKSYVWDNKDILSTLDDMPPCYRSVSVDICQGIGRYRRYHHGSEYVINIYLPISHYISHFLLIKWMWSYIWQSQIFMIIIHCLPKENIHLVAISLLLMTHLLYQYIAVVYVDSYSYYRVTDANKLAIMVVYTRQNDNPEVSLWYALELYHQIGFAENKTHHFSNNIVMFYTFLQEQKLECVFMTIILHVTGQLYWHEGLKPGPRFKIRDVLS